MSTRSALHGRDRHDSNDPIQRFIRLLAKAIVKRLRREQGGVTDRRNESATGSAPRQSKRP